MPQERRFLDYLDTSQIVFALVYFQDCLDQIVDVALGVDPPWNGQAQEFVARRLTEHYRTNLYRADAGVPIKRNGKRLSGKLMPRNLWQHLSGIDIDSVSTRRLHNRYSAGGDMTVQISGRCNPIFKILRLQHFFETDCNGIQISAG